MTATVGVPGTEQRRRRLAEYLPMLRAALERDRAFRVEQLTAMTAGGGLERSRNEPAPADVARAEVDALVTDGARRALSDIEHALAAMRTGRYGRCGDCGKDISIAMLRAVPQARWCMDCHRAHDEPAGQRRTQALPRPEADRRPSPRTRTSCARSPRSVRPVIWVRALLGQALMGPQGQHLGHVQDVTALWRASHAAVTGIVADVGGLEVSIPISAIRELHDPQVIVHSLPLDHARDRQPDEFPLARCAMRKPVLTGNGAVHRITDIALRREPAGWVVWAVDTGNVLERFLGSPRGLVPWNVLVGRRFAPVPPRRTSGRAP